MNHITNYEYTRKVSYVVTTNYEYTRILAYVVKNPVT